MNDVASILETLGPAERLALTTGRATQKTSDKLASKKLSRFIKGPPQRAYARTVWITLDLTPMGHEVAAALDAVPVSS